MIKNKAGGKILKELNDSMVDPDPVRQFIKWYRDAVGSGAGQPDAMFLATAGESGQPAGRVVLLKEVNSKGFVFFTNYLSIKGKEIGANPFVALTFYWRELERQVRILGKAGKVTKKESDEYFASRPFESQVSASISQQSSVVPDRTYLEKKAHEFIRDNKGKKIPRPKHWGGYRVTPFQVEFWQGREHRLHDRICYTLENGKWNTVRLSP
jgi:pyridoxamine 5'-phosphate oxidase